MLKGIHAGDAGFMVDLNRIENRITQTDSQITSGIRVSQAQDDPFAIQSILSYQDQLDQLGQLQKNLNVSKTDAQNADAALSTAGTILNQLLTTASQGVSSTSTSQTRSVLAISAKQLTQQLVDLANTQTGTRYIFGGDQPLTPPYKFDDTQTSWAVPVQSNPAATSVLTDSNGSTLSSGLTAKAIFDDTSAGGASIFQTAQALSTALTNNDVTGIQTALGNLHTGISHLSSVTATYGNIESFIDNALNQAQSQTTSLTATLSSLRDTDMTAAITQMTADQTSLQAAVSAHASLPTKTLFDYLG